MPSADDTVSAFATVNTPTAGQTVVATAVLPAGHYEIDPIVYTSGTGAGLDSDNMALFVGTTQVAVIIYAQGATGISAIAEPKRITLVTPLAISIQAIGNATSGCVYHAEINATLTGIHIGI